MHLTDLTVTSEGASNLPQVVYRARCDSSVLRHEAGMLTITPYSNPCS